ncbi:DUF3304 domain-containing protein [Paraburkholderia acidipaludis]|uniref:DUF3304 domain-containing protein n=1 Tax=Paraburkholderia acidipaludis TaxID=660537 RepID=UPI0012EC7F64|nr:DUF3304 domain-containing protein [Paraburkholderia acidipaludis]
MNTQNANETFPSAQGKRRRKFLPERKPGHPLWQWVPAVGFRIAVVPVASLVLVAGVGFCQAVTKTGSYGEFDLMGFNRTDRYIAQFYVEGQWGGNLFPKGNGGGGSATCCTSIPRGSKTLHVRWVLGWKTDEQFRNRAPQETYEADVPLPVMPRGAKSGHIQIYFFPGNRISAMYTTDLDESEVKPQVVGRRIADTPYNG